MPWRPANIKSLEGSEALHVLNQLFRETNFRIDNVEKAQQPSIRGQAVLNYGTVPANSCVDRAVSILGVNQNHVAHANPITTIGANLSWSTSIKSANSITIRVCNPTASGIAANTIKWKVLAQ